VFGHSGSQAPQLIHSSVIMIAIVFLYFCKSTPDLTQKQMPNSPIQQRIQSISQLGAFLTEALKSTGATSVALSTILDQAMAQNRWFTHESMRQALSYWAEQLSPQSLSQWVDHYEMKEASPKRVLLILAGNIPLVGFHDVLCTYLSGHISVIKASQKDSVLLSYLLQQLTEIDPQSKSLVDWTTNTTTNFEAVIATGSTNSSRYFDYYFNKYPHIIRRNRNSLAYLEQSEQQEHLKLLCNDVFDYFGLGCRNVTHLLLQKGFELNRLEEELRKRTDLLAHNKYMNNVDYHRSVFIMNGQDFKDAGTALLVESQSISSLIGVIHYQWINDEKDASAYIQAHQEAIQCVVSASDKHLNFGDTQQPALGDYADQIDTLDFLLALNK
jgi:hypothetical protein